MRQETVKGNDLMVFLDGRSVAFATNHVLTIQREYTEVTSKQSGGRYRSIKPRLISWSITSENLYSDEAEDLHDCLSEGTEVTVVFGRKQELYTPTLDDGNLDYWTPATYQYWTGTAYVTALQVNSPTGEKATMSVTLEGTGLLTRTGNSTPPDPEPVDDPEI